ncbi:MAG: dockerin type I repeat-containing protein [Bacteroidaceae bacterium]|nr:dockerin type I repeat-containing protein [Bacteroidaceae bacterium]
MKKILMVIVVALTSVHVAGQSFKDDYKSVGVYDTWELSPFRTGVLAGNAQVIKNHLYSASGVNRTGHILGVQRSRFGSNTFGARVDLNSPVTIGRSGKYVHALVYTPQASQVQLIGLGRRTTNTWNEGTDVEQFWSDPVTISANTWTDIVAKVQTNENVEIHSIVVVPDCKSPHTLTSDFVAYIDEIVVNSSNSKRSSVTSTVDPYEEGGDDPEPDDPTPGDESEYYKTNFVKTQANTRVGDSHYIRKVSLKSGSNQTQYYPSNGATADLLSGLLYLDATASAVFDVTAGQSYTPAIDYATDWMHAYAYVDYNRDGEFTNALEEHTATSGWGWNQTSYKYYTVADVSELVAYSAYATNYTGGSTGNFYNSTGTSSGNNTMTMPSFTIPSDLQSGLYRMRFKVDWCSLDAGGNDGSDGTGNTIWGNGGGIVDVLLRVTGNDVVDVLSSSHRNGTMTDSEGNDIGSTPLEGTYQTPYEVMMLPANGFVTESLTVNYKVNSSEWPGVLTTAQATYTLTDDNYDKSRDSFTLPAEVMYSEVNLEPMYNNAPTPTYPPGDINWDQEVTIADVTALVSIILGKDGVEPYQYNHVAADVNGDGDITIADVTALVNVILGK